MVAYEEQDVYSDRTICWYEQEALEGISQHEGSFDWSNREEDTDNEEGDVAFMATDPSPKEKSTDVNEIWYMDSGCSRHMTCDKRSLVNYKEKYEGPVSLGSEEQVIEVFNAQLLADIENADLQVDEACSVPQI